MKKRIFTLQDIWNEKVRNAENSRVKVRDYVSASDFGKPMIDRWYKMKGYKPTNPPDERVLRIFDSGKWFEQLAVMVYGLSGIVEERQKYIEIPETKNHLKVLGFVDLVIGGTVDWDERRLAVKKMVSEMGKLANENKSDVADSFEEQTLIFERYANKVIDALEKQWGDVSIPRTAIEFKTINSMAFWSHKNRDKEGNFLGYDHHRLQLFTYLKGLGLEFGRVTYISKDDLVLQEVGVGMAQTGLEKIWLEDLEKITYYYKTNEEPPKEPEVVFNERKKIFEGNWKVKRSPYLTLIYGYESQDDFDKKHHQELLDINRALRHLRKGKLKPEDHYWIEKMELNKYI